ncbi:hypothetical protein [Flavobacterium sp. AG291]|uniref:hypothetical protein n=1 Tax=Flavobacterium sp. AG291 TaxID=2184000 RepID=UPI000E2CDEF7|nr:hypothetical protein [Flavobacterium sp. AG291]RDI15965.1 hypothetical protein DEU42_101261 [Flavobacterium sp. AG291]
MLSIPKAMEAKKDIGKAIREKLDSLDRQPNDAMWGAISADLDKQQKKKRKFFPFFWLYIIICTIIGITATAYVLSNTENTNKKDNSQRKGTINTIITSEESKNAESNTMSTPTSSGSNTSENRVAAENNKVSISTTKTEGNTTMPSKNVKNTVSDSKASQKNSEAKVTIESSSVKTKQKQARTNNNISNKDSQSETAYTEKDKPVKSKKTSKTDTAATDHIATLGNKSKNANRPDALNENTAAKNKRTTEETDTINDSSLAATTNNDNAATNNEKSSSAIETKNIGNGNIESITDTTKVAADSLKVTVPTEEAKKDDENKKDSIPPVPYKKFSVYAYGGPSYFSFPNSTVVTDSTTSDLNTKSTTRFGVLFGYHFNHKLSIRTGVSVYKLKQSANGIKLNYTMESTGTEIGIMPPDNFTWIDYSDGVTNGSVIDKLATVSVNNYAAIINIDRKLSYFEIPIEVSYNLFDRRFGVNLFSGGSMLLLNKNEVFAYNENGRVFLGEWNAAKKTSFTGVLGLGLHYKINPSFQVNAEPVFNYYFNSYSNSKPYSFTFRIGLQYNFDL